MPSLKFFDLKRKKSFTTDKFTLKMMNGRKMAVAKAPSGIKATRFVSSDFKMKRG